MKFEDKFNALKNVNMTYIGPEKLYSNGQVPSFKFGELWLLDNREYLVLDDCSNGSIWAVDYFSGEDFYIDKSLLTNYLMKAPLDELLIKMNVWARKGLLYIMSSLGWFWEYDKDELSFYYYLAAFRKAQYDMKNIDKYKHKNEIDKIIEQYNNYMSFLDRVFHDFLYRELIDNNKNFEDCYLAKIPEVRHFLDNFTNYPESFDIFFFYEDKEHLKIIDLDSDWEGPLNMAANIVKRTNKGWAKD